MTEPIYETVITSQDSAGRAHVAPMGVRYRPLADGSPGVVLMPFKPSTTHDNIVATGHAVLNIVSDTRVFATCVTGRRDAAVLQLLSLAPSPSPFAGQRLACALRHLVLRLQYRQDDAQRPLLHLAVLSQAEHAPFIGLNRAQAAVVEGAVLVSRLHLLPADKISREMDYLQIAIDKTAAAEELQAWGWLRAAVVAHLQLLGASPPQASPPVQHQQQKPNPQKDVA